jgi:prolipoprotein diacylglyceryltransferase
MYTFGRIWFEALRIDDATKIFGIRFNLLLSVVLCIVGVVWFVWLGRRAQPSELHPHRRAVSPADRSDSEDTDETAEPAVAQVDDRQA